MKAGKIYLCSRAKNCISTTCPHKEPHSSVDLPFDDCVKQIGCSRTDDAVCVLIEGEWDE